MKNMKWLSWVLMVIWIFIVYLVFIQVFDVLSIIKKVDDKLRGEMSNGMMKMIIVRFSWFREIMMKFWFKGMDYSLILIIGLVWDKGVVFLKREKEIWNW